MRKRAEVVLIKSLMVHLGHVATRFDHFVKKKRDKWSKRPSLRPNHKEKTQKMVEETFASTILIRKNDQIGQRNRHFDHFAKKKHPKWSNKKLPLPNTIALNLKSNILNT